MDASEALSRITASHQVFLDALSSLTEADITILKVEGVWTAKDLVGHLTAWELTLLEPLRSYIAGGAFEPGEIPDHDAWNLVQSSRRNAWSISEVRQEMETVRQLLLNELHRLSAEQWQTVFLAPWGGSETLAEMVSGLAWHEEEHTKSILKITQRI